MGQYVITVPFYDLGVAVRSQKAELHDALDEVLQSGYFVGGALATRFEEQFAAYLGSPFCVGTANGLDSIRLILEAYGIGHGDEVIVPAFTFYATWLGVIQTGATPVPVDVRRESANLDPDLLESAITSKTRAIIPVHLFGQAADLASIVEVAKRHGVIVVEDAAQSHGSMSNAGMTGTVGDAAAFSFYPTKNLGALGDAGGVTTSSADIADRVRSRGSYGKGESKYDHVDTGWNSRLDPLQAAFLSVELRKLPEWTSARRAIATTYREALGHKAGAVVGPTDVGSSVWHHFVLRAAVRKDLQSYLSSAGVNSDIHYPYVVNELAPVQSLMRDADRGKTFPVGKALSQQVTSLPMGPWMTSGQIDQVAEALRAMPAELLEI
jgi:dTDP-3-amino-3,4,6-trideoxy-alpha-D-glucose transaminase